MTKTHTKRMKGETPSIRKYSVLLLVPDYLAENYGVETYLAWVTAETPGAAVRKGKIEARNEVGNEQVDDHDDFQCLLCCNGHVDDMTPEES